MRSGGADYRDEARTEHMLRAIGCIQKLLPADAERKAYYFHSNRVDFGKALA